MNHRSSRGKRKRKHDIAVGENFSDWCSRCCGELPRFPPSDQDSHSPKLQVFSLLWLEAESLPRCFLLQKGSTSPRVTVYPQRQLLSNDWGQKRSAPLFQFGTTLKGYPMRNETRTHRRLIHECLP